ncbi:hypothetical protein ABZ371_09685 [Streptomyces sp. NPDC005899]|uniref:hypothetical protein n=1 Tax=Streptomyces sp. NPDC005899 TaxID=3155716 RepID=UPI0033F6114C
MRGLLRPAAIVATLVALTGCGIQETDVIGASGPATIDVLPARQVRMLLFFLSPDGTPVPVPRTVGGDAAGFGEGYVLEGEEADSAARPSTAKTVAALMAGPREGERRAGLRNDPSLTATASDARIRVSLAGSGAHVVVAAPLGGLAAAARRQLVCTVSYAESADGGIAVTLRGTDGALAPEHCEPWTTPPATPSPTVTPGRDAAGRSNAERGAAVGKRKPG